MNERKYYRIGEASKICNVPIKTLRYYDEVDILKPAKIDEQSGYRYYTVKEFTLISVIRYFKDAGFSLKEIKRLLKRDNLDYNRKKIDEKCREIDDKISDLLIVRQKLQFCSDITYKEHENIEKNEKIVIKDIPECFVAYYREMGEVNSDDFVVRYCRLHSLIKRNNFHMNKNVMAVYYDNCISFEKNSSLFDIEVCAPISMNKEIPGKVRKFGGFKAASMIHYGKYDTMINSYRKMNEYIKENGYEICGPAVDNYLVDIVSTADENNYITELLIPIRKKP
ncbi:MerR family transcriptional regulator [Clostridium sp. BJN0001]|uniref:MerR family transcriptional regulator n=1 Tax=Clostridium sp. BJN0001 TaxID=2930219 RepID=UPI001FCFED57|nr:MerR family transcriptional regulator [Clostridium sp. BJN0001]